MPEGAAMDAVATVEVYRAFKIEGWMLIVALIIFILIKKYYFDKKKPQIEVLP